MSVGVVDLRGHVMPVFRPGTVQTKAYTGTAGVIDNAVGSLTRIVRVWCSTDAHILIGSSPTATTSHTPITAKVPEYFAVRPGKDKVSAVQQSSNGTLYVTELE